MGHERRRSLSLALLAGTILATVSVTQAWSQSAAVAREEARNVSIPAGPLTPALNRLASQTGLQILFDAQLATGKTTAGAKGRLSPAQALSAVLAGTGLSAHFTTPGAVTISWSAASGGGAAVDGAISLETIDVRGETAWGPVNGYSATRSAAGTKTDTPLIETPRSVSVISRKELDDRNVQSVPEAVRYTAGVTTGAFGYDPRFDQIYVRGFALTTIGDYRDGMRQGAGGYATFRTEPYGLERIDIIKGPASVLFGQSSPGGLVDRISKMPTAENRREIVGEIGSFGRVQGAFDISGPLDPQKQFLYRVVGLARGGDTNYEIADKRLYLAPSFTWAPTTDTSLTIMGHVQRDETDSNVAFANRNGVATGVRASDAKYDYQKQEQYQVGYRFQHRFSDTFAFRQNLRFGAVNLDTRYLTGGVAGAGFANAASTIYRRGSTAVVNRYNVFTVDNQVQTDFVTGPFSHTLLTGLDYQSLNDEFGQGTLAANPAYAIDIANPVYGRIGVTPPITARSRTKTEQIGIYAQDQIKFGNWRLALSGRQDYAQRSSTNLITGAPAGSKDDSKFTYSGGLLYLFDNGFAPYVSYATSFQPVTLAGLNGALLDPSEGRQIEAGLKYQPADGRLSVTASMFSLTELNAAKLAGTNPTTGLLYYQSVGKIQTRGFEIEARGKLGYGFEATAAYTYSDAEIRVSTTPGEIGKVPAVTPRHVASLWLNHTVEDGPLIGLGAGVGVRYTSQTYTTNLNVAQNDPAAYLDATLRYDFGAANPQLKGLTGSISATNLLDTRREVCNSGLCYVGQDRTLLARLAYRW